MIFSVNDWDELTFLEKEMYSIYFKKDKKIKCTCNPENKNSICKNCLKLEKDYYEGKGEFSEDY
jgi:hypothetical protein